MANLKACIIYAYPNLDSIHGSRLLEIVKTTLQDDSVPFEVLDLYRLGFNPVLSEDQSRNWGANLDVQILKYQSILSSSNAWILIYPCWWSSPPAILKGFFDRVLTNGFSHKIQNGHVVPLLNGHNALILQTFSYCADQEKKLGSISKHFVQNAILSACGINSNEIDIYSVDTLAPSAFEHTLKYVPGAVRRILATPTEVPHHLRSIPAPYLPPIVERVDKIKQEREKKEKTLSKDALADLNYFRTASKRAKEMISSHPDASNQSKRRFFTSDSSNYSHPRANPMLHKSSNKHKKKNKRRR